MKNFNLFIQDKDEKDWDFLVKNKEEKNIHDTIMKLVKKEVKRLKNKR